MKKVKECCISCVHFSFNRYNDICKVDGHVINDKYLFMPCHKYNIMHEKELMRYWEISGIVEKTVNNREVTL